MKSAGHHPNTSGSRRFWAEKLITAPLPNSRTCTSLTSTTVVEPAFQWYLNDIISMISGWCHVIDIRLTPSIIWYPGLGLYCEWHFLSLSVRHFDFTSNPCYLKTSKKKKNSCIFPKKARCKKRDVKRENSRNAKVKRDPSPGKDAM